MTVHEAFLEHDLSDLQNKVDEKDKRIKELELKIKHITEHLEPQAMTALFEQVEEEVKQEQKIKELEKENSRLNQIILGNEEEITDLQKDCEEYSKTFNRQNDKIISLRKKMIKAKEIIEGLMRFCRCFAQHHTEDIRYKEAEKFLKG